MKEEKKETQKTDQIIKNIFINLINETNLEIENILRDLKELKSE